MKKTLKNYYLNYLRERAGTWYLGVELERLSYGWKYSASNGSRTLRSLYTDGKLKKRYNPKGLVEYAYRATQEAML